MNDLQKSLLKATQAVVSQHWLPGRYVLAEWASKQFTANTAVVEGRIGAYLCQFDFHDLMQRQAWFGLYDQSEIKLLRQVLRPGDTFLDIGANIGYYSLYASQFVGSTGRVIAFEPISYNIGVIRRNLEINQIQNITLVEAAVGQADGALTLYFSDDAQSNTGVASIIQTPRKSRAQVVPMTAIDTYLEKNNIDHVDTIKMDIEGAEYEALQGMKRLLSAAHKPKIICEFNQFLLNKRNLDASVIFRYLQDFGYQFHNITSDGLKPVDADLEIQGVMNILCSA